MKIEHVANEEVKAVPPPKKPPVRPAVAAETGPTRRPDPPTSSAADKVDLSYQERVSTDLQYEVSEAQELIVKVVNAHDRSEVIRQYPSEEVMNFRTAYRDFLKLVGLG